MKTSLDLIVERINVNAGNDNAIKLIVAGAILAGSYDSAIWNEADKLCAGVPAEAVQRG